MKHLLIGLLALFFLLPACGSEVPDDDDATASNDDDDSDDDSDDDDSASDDDDSASDDDDDDDDDDSLAEVPGQEVSSSGFGASARWAYEESYTASGDGAWYRGSNNEGAALAWGESYVMMSLASMFRTTGDPVYLSRLAWHVDEALAQRDDARGVTDYRGVSAGCWRNLHYQPGGEAYCYVVHSGMIGYPIAELARLVVESGLEDEPDSDGVLFGDKVPGWIAAAQEVAAAHEDQWDPAGHYTFRPDASFLSYPGVDLPFNQSHAMGRLLLTLHVLTGELDYLDKATAMAQAFQDATEAGSNGGLYWNYWGGPYQFPGEDISHGALSVDFAWLASEHGVVFDQSDLDGFAETFFSSVYQDDATFSDAIGGGPASGTPYAPQAGRWLRAAQGRSAVYAATRQLYDVEYPPGSYGSGWLPLGWALLAELEPAPCSYFYYYIDWDDPDPSSEDDWVQATAYGANLLTTPPDLGEACLMRMSVDLPRTTLVQQWDGEAYHDVAKWQATGGPSTRYLAYDPSWPHAYWSDGVLFQFVDDWVAGGGLLVQEPALLPAPEIVSTPPSSGEIGVPLDYSPEASLPDGIGDEALWWSLRRFPVGARVDPGTGALDWTPSLPGEYSFTLELRSDGGITEQDFEVTVP